MSQATVTAPFDAPTEWRQALVYAAALEAGVLAALPGPVGDVAERAGTDERATRVCLEALEAWGIVESNGTGQYRSGPAFPSAAEEAALVQQSHFIRSTAAFLPDRLQGVASPAAGRSQADLGRWQAAMGNRARAVAPAVVEACLARVPRARRVLDLGGGHGEYGLAFASRGLDTVLQDRATMLDLPGRGEVWAAAGVETFAGDFFETLADGPFDIVFCTGVTHTFDGDHNRRLYARVRPLLAPGGVFVIGTRLRGTPQARMFAIQMLVVGSGGDTHSEEEYRVWLQEAGFGMEVVHFDDLDVTLVVARPS